MFILCGLGNPGGKYQMNRHNVGFMTVDAVHRRHNFGPWKSKFQSDIAEGRLGEHKTLLVKPQTFMNESGRAVANIATFYKLKPSAFLVAYDELDLAPGKTRLKTGGGHGGHNGIRSISQHIGPDFRRLRIGIGHPGSREAVVHWVLGDFSKTERTWIDPLTDAIADSADLLATGDDGRFSNKVHLATADLLPDIPARGGGGGGKPAKTNKSPTAQAQRKAGDVNTVTATTEKTSSPADQATEAPKSAIAEGLRKLFGR